MPNSDKPNKPTTTDELPPLLRVFPRASKIVDGHTLIACICSIELEDRGEMLTATRRDAPESPWMPGESCSCGGTKWICVQCHSHQWVQPMDKWGWPGKAVPCGKCSEITNSAVTWQPWMLKFRNGNAPPRNVRVIAPLDRAKIEAERAQREQARQAGMARISDEQVNWENLYEAA